MIGKKKLTSIIGVRKGSQRIKNKNIRKFNSTNLLEIKIKQLKKIKDIDEIIVSSDSDKMLSIAKKLGVTTHEREAYYASSKANNSEVFENWASFIDSDFILYSPVTAPLIKKESIEKCINFLKKKSRYKSVATTKLVKEHMWLNDKPFNYKLSDSPGSQNLPDVMSITFGCSIIKKTDMLKFRNVVTDKTKFIVLDEIEAIDIDTEIEFQFAEFLHKKMSKK
ncbi:cytidylyltransferase [Alphaproteobacteria bacterium]|nr:cytidylyltransferase [Alphaproteobacteria bacterium]